MKLKTIMIALGAAVALSGLPFVANAAEPVVKKPFKPDPGRGLETATKLCASCHIIDRQQTGTAQPGVPSFFYMADKPEQDEKKLSNSMIHPFEPMIDTHLTVHEIKDIAAYILSLKSEQKSK